MIHFPLMPVSEPGELDPVENMVIMEFESPRAYAKWQLMHGLEPKPAKKYRMATYAECGAVMHALHRIAIGETVV